MAEEWQTEQGEVGPYTRDTHRQAIGAASRALEEKKRSLAKQHDIRNWSHSYSWTEEGTVTGHYSCEVRGKTQTIWF